MKEITYLFSLNYNMDFSNNEVIETRSIKRAIENEGNDSSSLQYLKADTQSYPVKNAAEKIVGMLSNESSLVYSDEITFEQFNEYIADSYDLFSIDTSQFELN